ncbi:MAG: 23S rRNA pseudouridine955/2504/2580 synthase [Candidatus Endobugula sp.]|jgi:23S rRNA pseudouridine955/2504/2580 synthase
MNESDVFNSVQFITIDAGNTAQRIDNFLLSRLKGVPKSRIYRIVRKGEVRVNKGRVKPEYKLCDGDVVRVPPIRVSQRDTPPQPSQHLAQLLESSILFENNDVLVVNKPSGLAVHGGSGISLGLIESFRQIRPDSRFLELVHRLDRDTSGCIMIAKKRSSLRFLQQELRERRVQKIYHALVDGRWPNRRKSVNEPLIKNQLATGARLVRIAQLDTEGAKTSLTQYRVIQRYQRAERSCTLVEAKPVTGRTHQIRVHSQSVGCSIIGDDRYCDNDVNTFYRAAGLKRLFLHAFQLQFSLPDGTPVKIEAPLGDDLLNVFNHIHKDAT